MEGFYLELRAIHIGTVMASGSLFLLRALALNLADARWVMAKPVRMLSMVIDTVLLAAALVLTTIIHQYPFVHGWLTVKVVLLIVYIGLGLQALRAPTRARRLLFTGAAAAVFLFIYSVARAHDPLGIFASL